MTVGSFKAKHSDFCGARDCARRIYEGDLIYYKHKAKGYFCSPECLVAVFPEEAENSKHLERRSSTPQQVTTTQGGGTLLEAADQRRNDIAKAHEENMTSDRQMRDVLAMIVTALDQLRQAIVDVRLMGERFRAEDQKYVEEHSEGKA